MITIQTPRLLLRPLLPQDAQDMFEYAADPRVGPSAGWPPHISLFQTQNILNTLISQEDTWAIVELQGGRMVGTVSLSPKNVINIRERTLGYVLNPRFWGQGIMSEAVSFVLEYAFNVMNLDIIRVSHFDDNARSAKLIGKFHFTRDGISRMVYRDYNSGRICDCVNYSLTRAEFYHFLALTKQ